MQRQNHIIIFILYQILSLRSRLCYTVLRLSVCLLSVTLCIVAKRCILEHKLLLTAIGSHKQDIDRYKNESMTLTFVKRSYHAHVNHCVTFVVAYLGNR